MPAPTAMRPVALWHVSPALPWAYPPSAKCIEAGAQPRRWPAIPLLDALERRHGRDIWFQAVTVPTRERWPRLAKPYLLELATNPDAPAVGLAYVVLDLDRPDHRGSPWPDAASAMEGVRATAERLDASVYATRGGLRAIWALPEPIPVDVAQSFLNQFHAQLPADLPVDVDRGVRDWTRGFRLPWCPRADEKVPAWGDAAPPMDLDRLRAGAVLTWQPPTLLSERAVVVRPVIWPDPTPSATLIERRIEGSARAWADKIEAASSHHAVILAAGRTIGGLCAHYGISPERASEILILAGEAAGSRDAASAVRSAVDYGAHEPIPFPPDARDLGVARALQAR